MNLVKKFTELGKIQYLIESSKQISPEFTFKDHNFGVSDLTINYLQNNNFFSAAFDNSIHQYDYIKCQIVAKLIGHTAGVWTIDHSKKDSILISGSNDNSIILWDSKSNKQINILKEHDEVIYDVQFSHKENFFASCSKGKICLWDMKNLKKPLFTLNDQKKEYVYSLNFVSNDNYLVSGLMDGSLLIINTADMKIIKQVVVDRINEQPPDNLDSGNSIYSIASFRDKSISNDDEFLVGFSDGSIKQYALNGNDIKLMHEKLLSSFPITCINSSIDDMAILAGTKDHIGIIFNSDFSDKFNYTLVGHHDTITAVEFIDKNTAITSSYDSTVKLWKLE